MHSWTPVVAFLLVAVAATLSLFVAAPAEADATTPTYPTWGVPPAGANDWSCTPTAARPDPAVIVHGTFGDQKSLLDRCVPPPVRPRCRSSATRRAG